MHRAALVLVPVLLAGCAPVRDPTVVGPGLASPPGPAWLPAGWVCADPPPIIPSDDRFHVYAPAGAAAPFVAVARFTPDEAERLAEQTGEDGYAWLQKSLNQSLEAGGLTLQPVEPWTRSGFRDGCGRSFESFWQERERGLLSGRLGLGAGLDGTLLVVVAAVPKGNDTALVQQLLESVPLVESGPEELQPEAVGHDADGT